MIAKAIRPDGWKGVLIAKLPNLISAAPATAAEISACDNAQTVQQGK